jgi:hypothetical protein
VVIAGAMDGLAVGHLEPSTGDTLHPRLREIRLVAYD